MAINSRRSLSYCRISISPNNHLIVGSSYMLYADLWQGRRLLRSTFFSAFDYAIFKYISVKASKPACISFVSSHVSPSRTAKAGCNIWFIYIVLMGLIFQIPLKVLMESQWVAWVQCIIPARVQTPSLSGVCCFHAVRASKYIVHDNMDKVG